MRRVRIGAAVCLCCLAAVPGLLTAACGGGEEASPSPSASASEVVVTVDGAPITQADVDAIKAELRLAGAADDQQAARAQAMRRLLVRREAARLGVAVAEADVSDHLDAIRANAGGEEALAAALAAAGMTGGQLETAARYSLLEAAVRDALFPELEPAAAAVKQYYRDNRDELFTTAAQVKLRQLTVPGERVAEEAAAEVRKGTPFAEVAQHYSMDTTTRFEGGMVGWVLTTSLPDEVAAAVAGLAMGGVSEPVYSFGRWHLYNVVGRRAARVVPFAEVRALTTERLTRQLRSAALDDWVREELQAATVESGS
jgi:parvulin-like peptidyl-prolyl isomerase